jgi:DNA-binding CsgD family transcriptional regulator
MPLRVADALDGLAYIARARGQRDHPSLAAAARALRAPRHAVAWGYAADNPVEAARTAPRGWVSAGALTDTGRAAVVATFSGSAPESASVLDQLTPAERQVAERVADGLTSRRIAEELFLSPRTIDAHLTHIYRKLDINSRTKLAALVLDQH